MWSQLLPYLTGLAGATIVDIDEDGNRYAVHCLPVPDPATQTIRLPGLPDAAFRSGPICLHAFRHNERPWEIESFDLCGLLRRDEFGWYLQPQRLILDDGGQRPAPAPADLIAYRMIPRPPARAEWSWPPAGDNDLQPLLTGADLVG